MSFFHSPPRAYLLWLSAPLPSPDPSACLSRSVARSAPPPPVRTLRFDLFFFIRRRRNSLLQQRAESDRTAKKTKKIRGQATPFAPPRTTSLFFPSPLIAQRPDLIRSRNSGRWRRSLGAAKVATRAVSECRSAAPRLFQLSFFFLLLRFLHLVLSLSPLALVLYFSCLFPGLTHCAIPISIHMSGEHLIRGLDEGSTPEIGSKGEKKEFDEFFQLSLYFSTRW